LALIIAFLSSEYIQNIIGIIAILCIGIIHGANDIKIISTFSNNGNKFKYFSFYLLTVLIGCLLFFFLPSIALLVFVLVSCFHFGEQHWESKLKPNKYNSFFYFFYGGVIFLLLFIIKHEDVSIVISQITGINFESIFFQISFLIFFLFFFIIIFFKKEFILLFIEILLLLFFILVFSNSTLIYAFSFYFIIWHSLPSLKSQINNLYGEVSYASIYNYVKSSILYWLISIVGLFSFYYFFDIQSNYFLPLFFSFLAAITFPHVIVISLMFQTNKNN
tara:strand:+ start:6819 stop:7646 length:828 start_codon:yes stop_codon:yes gene_type:complete